MSSELSETSKKVLEQLTSWTRQQRESFIKDIEFQYEEYKECRILEQTYTKAEVEDALHGLFLIIQASVNQESSKVGDGFRAYVRSILKDAERQHALIHVGTNILDWASSGNAVNGDDAVHDLAVVHSQLLDAQRSMSFKKLVPLNTTGGADSSIADVNPPPPSSLDTHTQEAITKLHEKLQKVTEMYAASKQEQALLHQENVRLREAAHAMQTGDTSSAVHIQKLTKEVSDLKREISMRLSNSTQFANLKKMMLDKNASIRLLRERLAKHEKLDDESDDEIAQRE